jgi:hypothetical protein
LIRGQEHIGVATPIQEDREKKIVGLSKLLAAFPLDAHFYDVAIDLQSWLDQNDLRHAADHVTLIKVLLLISVKIIGHLPLIILGTLHLLASMSP